MFSVLLSSALAQETKKKVETPKVEVPQIEVPQVGVPTLEAPPSPPDITTPLEAPLITPPKVGLQTGESAEEQQEKEEAFEEAAEEAEAEEAEKEEGGYEKEPLEVSATATPNKGQASLTVTFKASASGGKCDTYVYSWSGAVEGIAKWITETFEEAGTYEAAVEVTCGDDTASDSASAQVTCGLGNCLDCCDSTFPRRILDLQRHRRLICHDECYSADAANALPDEPPCCRQDL